MTVHDLDAFRLPTDRKVIVHVSGGRTSAVMLWHLLQAHDGRLPDNTLAVFTNTGKEREETLVFLREIERRWSCPILWLEYTYRPDRKGGLKDQKNWYRVVTFETARRDGEPFAELIRSRKMLPNTVRRMCTAELKVNTVNRYARVVLKWRRPWSCLGIRYDERRRWEKALWTECRTIYPLVTAQVTVDDVTAFWEAQPFDLGIRSDQGNCDLCFLKSAPKLIRLMHEEPERAAWWIEQEEYRQEVNRTTRKPEMLRFRKKHTYRDLMAMQLLPLAEEADGPSCFCGD